MIESLNFYLKNDNFDLNTKILTICVPKYLKCWPWMTEIHHDDLKNQQFDHKTKMFTFFSVNTWKFDLEWPKFIILTLKTNILTLKPKCWRFYSENTWKFDLERRKFIMLALKSQTVDLKNPKFWPKSYYCGIEPRFSILTFIRQWITQIICQLIDSISI